MNDKKWHENIPQNGALCKHEKEIVCCIYYNKDFNRVVDSQGEAWFPEHLTPLTADEWWEFAPWHDMDSAPRDGTLILIKQGLDYHIGYYDDDSKIFTCGEYPLDRPEKWLPLPQVSK